MAGTNVRRVKPATANRLSAYFLHHLQSLTFSLGKIYHAPATTIMTVTVIGITLSLPGGFYLFLKNIDAIAGDFRSTTQISLFLDLDISEKRARVLEKDIASMANVVSTRFISRDQSLKEFRENSGFGKSIDTLSSNPLPHTIVVEPGEADTFAVRNLLNALQAMPEVEIAKLDTEWLERLYTIVEIAKRSVAIITILFACAVLLVIGNTIRLDIQNRYQEIIVTKLIGATDAFIRRPFLYGGIWYGLLGGIISWLIVEIGYVAISGPLERLNLLYQSEMTLITFSLPDFIILITSSTLLGLAGSWIAVARHLNQIEPT
ncbi:MAG: permease-like cell division protein FtsX [Gammaproteobacteria bacterium]|nr:permease-like cell division protein FtsX [Gammaproteobacteria bacterium]MDH3449634.1 permease-like cell division protein FtsX [Gammaproteobacteria bacterium]